MLLVLILLWTLLWVLFIAVCSWLVSAYNRYRRAVPMRVLRIEVPRDNESGPIFAEQIFATLQGLQSEVSLWQRLKGHQPDRISFELIGSDEAVHFQVAVPQTLTGLLQGQIYAHYPEAHIKEATDPPINPERAKQALGVELCFTESDIFPIKRYNQFEDRITRKAVDPIAGITAALIDSEQLQDEAWVQIIVSPLPARWRIVFTKCVRILKRGVLGNIEFFRKAYARAFTTRQRWPKLVFAPVYLLFWLQGLLVTARVEPSTPQKTKLAVHDEIDEATSITHDRESELAAAMDKVVRPLFEVTIRIVHLPKTPERTSSRARLRDIAAAFCQFNFPHLNGFKPGEYLPGRVAVRAFKRRRHGHTLVMSSEELATLYHPPHHPVKAAGVKWTQSRKLEPPTNLPQPEAGPVTVLGRTDFRGQGKPFGLKPEDRRRHCYLIGKTGMGKSTLLANMIASDIKAGLGVGVIDPHGDLAETILGLVPSHRINDVIYIDPSDLEFATGFNMLEDTNPERRSVVAGELVSVFKRQYGDSWGPRLEHILRNAILSLLEYPGATMLGITRVLQDPGFRKRVLRSVKDPVVKSFWLDEFEKMPDRFQKEAISPIQNKVGQFLASSTIRNIVGQPKSSVSFRQAMDRGQLVIINLSKGKLGEHNSALLGSMFVTRFQLDAMSRANIPESKRRDFGLYIDEFQSFATSSFATILSEARKYRLNLTMANQYVGQMPLEVREAVFGNVGSLLSFQVGFEDAELLRQQFGDAVDCKDLVGLPKHHAYARLLVDGMPTGPFSLVTFPLPTPELSHTEDKHIEKIKRVSRQRYATPIKTVQDRINRWASTRS